MYFLRPDRRLGANRAGPRAALAAAALAGTSLVAASVANAVLPVADLSAAASPGPSMIAFAARDWSGRLLSCDAFRALQTNAHTDRGYNDALVDPATLAVTRLAPLECASTVGATVMLRRPAGATALSLAWPSTSGYSTAILDLPVAAARRAPMSFERLVAEQSLADLRATRSHLGLSSATPPVVAAAEAAMRRAKSAAAIARASWVVWDVASAQIISALSSAPPVTVGGANAPWRGVSFNSLAITDRSWSTAVGAVGTGGWIRLLLDRDEPVGRYRSALDRAHSLGLRVMGQILDSSQMASVPLSAWRARVVEYLAAFPDIDGWEVGNEINGNWLGDDVLAKVAYAADAVKACCPNVPTVATLLWNLGEDSDADALFNWAATMPASLLAHLDVVGLSLYPEDHPLGTAFDRVVTTLHRRFPTQRIAVTELGYGNDEFGRTWWWGSRTDIAAGRREVARLYDAASRAYHFSGGGTFWWYFLDEGDVR